MGGIVESIINAQTTPNMVPATMKSQPRRAIPMRSAISGFTGPTAGWDASPATWLSSMEAMEFTHLASNLFSTSIQFITVWVADCPLYIGSCIADDGLERDSALA